MTGPQGDETIRLEWGVGSPYRGYLAANVSPVSDVVVLGSGFAGLWAALGAARRIDELGVAPGEVNITVVSSLPYHDIRVRNYEADLTACRIPLRDVLDPVGVGHIAADVTAIDPGSCTVATSLGTRAYDRLVMALGSRVVKPDVPGLREFGFDVDTYDGALRLQRHLVEVASSLHTLAAATAIVVGAGLTGIETACELPARLATLFPDITPRVILVDHNRHVGSDMGDVGAPSDRGRADGERGADPARCWCRRDRWRRSDIVDRGKAGRVDSGVVCRYARQSAYRGSGRRV